MAKYGRHSRIWDVLEEAVRALPEPMSRGDLLAYIVQHYPQVHQVTASTYINGAVEDAGNRHQFAANPPLLRRVGRGLFVRSTSSQGAAPAAAAIEPRPDLAPSPVALATNDADEGTELDEYDVVLVSCGKAKRPTPSPAKLLYTSSGFRRRRRIAEVAGEQWFILSAEHGLVLPDEWLAPYDFALASATPAYRRAWGEFVVARLARRLGELAPLRGAKILVLAPAPYADAIREPLRQQGAQTHEPLAGLPQGLQGRWLKAQVRDLPELEEQVPLLPFRHIEGGASAVDTKERERAIAEALVEYRETHMDPSSSRLGFAQSAEGDALIQADPFAFLVAVILDEGIPAERAWEGPLVLRKRLGHLDPWLMQHQLDGLLRCFETPPMIHRYRVIMPAAIADAARRVCEDYGGDASRIWADGLSASGSRAPSA